MITYNMYSYQYYYIHSRANSNNMLDSNSSMNYDWVNNYQNIIETVGFGYVLIGIWGWYCWKFVKDIFDVKDNKI